MKELERKIVDLQSGDGSAFDYIYEQTYKTVYFSALYIVRDKGYAEDILQETYLKAMANINSYKVGTNFVAWIVRIAKNLALNHVKRAKRETLTDFVEDEYRYGTTQTTLPFIFEVAMDILDEDEYQILMLCNTAGYKRREVAKLLNMPIPTVTWKNNQALKKLRKYLEKEDNC